jgi:hypothetical protein
MSQAEIKVQWKDITQGVAHQLQGQVYALALSCCVPIQFETREIPAVLMVQTDHPSVVTLLQDAVKEGILPGILLPVLGRVCRVRVEEGG